MTIGDVAHGAGSATATPPPADARTPRDVSKQIRGSSLLMVGRLMSIGVNLLVQALIVRTLTKAEYGAFAYALSVVTMLSTFVTLGIDRAIPRFIAMYDEQGERSKLLGTLVIQLSTIGTLGLSAVVLVVGLQDWLADSVISDRAVVPVLVILIVLTPIQALDELAVALFAVYARPSAIFFRRYLLTPALRLAVVALLWTSEGGPRFLAVGYVVTGVLGVALYGAMLVPLMRAKGLFGRSTDGAAAVHDAQGPRLSLPWAAVLGYSLPLMLSDLMYAVLNTSDVVLIGRYADSEAVAAYRAVLPAAKMNQFVMTSFALLYVPLAARLLTRGDREGISELYWRTAAWIAVATFPMFALTFSLADRISVTMFGAEYSESGTYMALLSLGYYFNAALGFNGLTVKTAGRVRYTVVISLLAVVTNLVLNFLLIPSHGALGAAVATLITLVIHNLLKQAGLRLGTGVRLYHRQFTPVYVVIVVTALALYALDRIVQPTILVGVPVAAAASLVVLLVARPRLALGEVFPEVARIPLVGRLLVGGSAR